MLATPPPRSPAWSGSCGANGESERNAQRGRDSVSVVDVGTAPPAAFRRTVAPNGRGAGAVRARGNGGRERECAARQTHPSGSAGPALLSRSQGAVFCAETLPEASAAARCFGGGATEHREDCWVREWIENFYKRLQTVDSSPYTEMARRPDK
jgi:hypothetical protein